MSESALIIRTGKPGNGKTLNTIKEVDAQAKKQGRTVYFYNVKGLKPELLQASWFEFEDPYKWPDLPDNSIIVIDEAQGWFGVRDPRKDIPAHISAFETLRHKGHEVHLITQDPRFIDVHARRLCGTHIHYMRVFGSNRVARFHCAEGVYEAVEKIIGYKGAEKTVISLDKKMFGVYTSSSGDHHFKFKPPKALFVLAGCLILIAGLGYKLKDRFLSTPDDPSAVSSPSESVVNQGAKGVFSAITGQQEDQPLTPAQYIAQRTPRIADVPSSAPVYDELTKPVSFPRTYCVLTFDPELMARNGKRMALDFIDGKPAGCQCFTQQNTRLNTSFAYCADVVQNGIFDPTKRDLGSSEGMQAEYGQRQPQPSAPARSLVADAQSSQQRPGSVPVTVIPDSEYPSRPWR